MATDDEYVESIPIPVTETSSEQTKDPQNEEPVSDEIIEFVDFSNEEFLAAYSKDAAWAGILSCKLFYEKDWLGAWTFNQTLDREYERKGYFRLLGINQAFDIAVVQKGVKNSKDEIRMIESYCREELIEYNQKDSRIPMPPRNFWETWDD
jgi:hypothetical protein